MSKKHTQTTLQLIPNRSFTTTVPAVLVRALGWEKGDALHWKIEKGRMILNKRSE